MDNRKTENFDVRQILLQILERSNGPESRPADAVGNFSLQDGTSLKLNGTNYAVLKSLGRGANGGVVLAENTSLKNVAEPWELEVVLKYAFDGEGPRNSLKREVQVMKNLQHPSLIRLIDNGTAEAIVVYQNGFSVKKNIDVLVEERLFENPYKFCREKPVPFSIAIDLFVNLLVGLEDFHGKTRHVHCDIKPDNILLRANRSLKRQTSRINRKDICEESRDRSYLQMALLGHWLPVIGDPGSAVRISERNIDGFNGSLAYASPESLFDLRISPKRDVYALTVSFVEMLTGIKPYARFEKDPNGFRNALRQNVSPFNVRESIFTLRVEEEAKAEAKLKRDIVRIIEMGIEQDYSKRASTYDLLQACELAFNLQRIPYTDQDGQKRARLTQGVFLPVTPDRHYWYNSMLRSTRRYRGVE